jgi:uncharacterized membrane protein
MCLLEDLTMRLSVKICLLLSMVLSVIAVSFYLYEAGYIGLLPVINYPLRPYALPFLIAGLIFLILGVLFHWFYDKPRRQIA